MRLTILFAAVAGSALAGVAAVAAVAQVADGQGMAAFRALLACRGQADAQRLACYDAAVARLDAAVRSGELTLVDKAEVKQARREAFGFEFKGFSFLRRHADDGASTAAGPRRQEPREEQIDSAVLTVARAYQDREGAWVFVTEDDQQWRQVDTESLYKAPRPGSTLAIRRAALNSYLAKVDGQIAIRVRRER